MTGKRGRKNRVFLSILLSMALLVEPAGAAVVHAENGVETEVSLEENENKEDDGNLNIDSSDDGKTEEESQKPDAEEGEQDPSDNV